MLDGLLWFIFLFLVSRFNTLNYNNQVNSYICFNFKEKMLRIQIYIESFILAWNE